MLCGDSFDAGNHTIAIREASLYINVRSGEAVIREQANTFAQSLFARLVE